MSDKTRTLITFKSKQFNTTQPQENFINECCFGDDLCRWLGEELTKTGATCDEPGQEDFGWYFNFRANQTDYCLVCSYRMSEDEFAATEAGKQKAEGEPAPPASNPGQSGDWILWVERAVGFMASIFGGREKSVDPETSKTLQKILSDAPFIAELKWHNKKDFDAGREDLASPNP